MWDFFDRIYCISLTHRDDRRHDARGEFARVGLAERVEFLIVEKHQRHSEQGIYESHMRSLRAGLESGARTIVVFEDDILLDRFKPGTLENIVRFIRSGSRWKMLFLGCFVDGCNWTNHPSVLSIRYRCTAHAYVVNRDFAEQLVQIPWRGVAYDMLLRSLADDQFFAAYPSFAFQSSSPSDNDRMARIDRIRKLLGGMHWQQKWNEFSHLKWPQMIVGHALSLAAIIGVIVLVRWWMHV